MRWILLLLLCLGLPAQADLAYRLTPRQIAEDAETVPVAATVVVDSAR